MVKNKTKTKPRGRPQVSTLKRLTKSVTVKFSKPDYEMLRHRSKNANRTLAIVVYAIIDQMTMRIIGVMMPY